MRSNLPQVYEPTCASTELQYWARITPRQLGYMNASKAAPWHLGGYGIKGLYTKRECFAVMFIAECRRKGMMYRDIKRHLTWLMNTWWMQSVLPDYLVITANARSRITSDARTLCGTAEEVISFMVRTGKPGFVVDLAEIRTRVEAAMSGAPHKRENRRRDVNPHGGIGLLGQAGQASV